MKTDKQRAMDNVNAALAAGEAYRKSDKYSYAFGHLQTAYVEHVMDLAYRLEQANRELAELKSAIMAIEY